MPPPHPDRVETVIFDYGGVLHHEDPADFDAFAATVGLPPGWLWAAFHDLPEYVLSRTGQIDAATYRNAVVGHLARVLPLDRAHAALSAWEARRHQDLPLEPAMDALLHRLHGRVRLGLLSNAGRGARARLDALGISARFDDVVCSGDVGLAKPDPAVFRLAAHRLHTHPTACVFIDDTERHVVAARDVGMHAHHYHHRRHTDLLAFLEHLGALPPSPALAPAPPRPTSPAVEILAHEDTPLGLLCLRRRRIPSAADSADSAGSADPTNSTGATVTEITLDHAFLMSSALTDSERTLAHTAIEFHGGQGLSVLIGGLGLGYTAHEALASPRVASVEVVELLPPVVAWLRDGLIPLSAALRDHPRLTLTVADVYARLAAPPTRTYDVIAIDVDHAPAENLATAHRGFYTEDGLRRARRHLAPGGVLGVWSTSEDAPFSAALARVFPTVRVEPVTVHNPFVDATQTDWLHFAGA